MTLIKNSLTEVSDRLIVSAKEFIDLDKTKALEKKLEKFKSCDGLHTNGNKLILMEFKKCDLFYKETLNPIQEKKVEEIIKSIPFKILETLLVLLPNFIDDFRTNSNYKIKVLIVLGSKKEGFSEEVAKLRNRATKMMKRPQLIKLETATQKYTSTPYIESVDIITKEDFVKKYKIN